ncbi:MAG TPA: hypothetical protein VHG08_22780 [Longimicrobium sp.]|nr:hypothetical protein [Longimicrobium sp.]
MKIPVRYAVAALLAAAAAVPAAAQPGPEPSFREAAERRPFELLLRHRDALGLTDVQVRQLETIGERLEQQNAPLRQRLVQEHHRWREERRAQLERMTPEQRREELRRMRGRRGEPPVPEALRPTVYQMRLNINDAMHQAQSVLTPAQRLRAQDILRREVRPLGRARAEELRARRRGQEAERTRRRPEPRHP